MEGLSQVGTSLFGSIKEVLDLWVKNFGTDFDKTWKDSNEAIKKTIKSAQNILNYDEKRHGHITVLLKEPLSDRLILEFSTQKSLNRGEKSPPANYFYNKEENYDPLIKASFYQLYDHLSGTEEKKSLIARQTRGLTGWVAVTGHFIKINSERAKALLEDIPKERPVVNQMWAIYGEPHWGRRTSEFVEDDKDDWSKRLLAHLIHKFKLST